MADRKRAQNKLSICCPFEMEYRMAELGKHFFYLSFPPLVNRDFDNTIGAFYCFDRGLCGSGHLLLEQEAPVDCGKGIWVRYTAD